MPIARFEVRVPQDMLDDLRRRLADTRWIDDAFVRQLSARPSAAAARMGRAFFQHRARTEMPRGGHFAALEEPELLVNDLRDFFRPLRPRIDAR